MNTIAHERRLMMLRVLHGLDDRRCNSRIIAASLKQLGLNTSAAELLIDLQWLRDGDLIALETLGDYTIAELLQRGEDVATGVIRVAGVARPGARG